MKTTISIANDYAKHPGGRTPEDGPNNGERFRDEILIPALNSYEHVVIDLDGTRGYGSSFLEETFGGLIRKGFTKEELAQRITLLSSREGFIEEINYHIELESKG